MGECLFQSGWNDFPSCREGEMIRARSDEEQGAREKSGGYRASGRWDRQRQGGGLSGIVISFSSASHQNVPAEIELASKYLRLLVGII